MQQKFRTAQISLLKVIFFIAIVVAILNSGAAEAREVKFKDFAFELRDGDRLAMTGVRGSVRLIPRTPAAAKGKAGASAAGGEDSVSGSDAAAPANANAVLRVRKSLSDKAGAKAMESFDQWTFVVRRDENVVRIEAKGPDAKADWESQFRTGFPELHFEIEAPPVPVDIALRDGNVQVQNWKGNLTIHLVEGQVRLAKNEGNLRLQVQKGDVRIDGHKGRVEVDGFNPKVQIASIEGDLILDNFAGDSAINNLKGNLQIKAFSGQAAAAQVDGGVDFELGRASLSVQALDGSLRGQLDNGAVAAKIIGDPEVNIESQEGAVSLDLDARASASVRLQTEDGNLTAPESLPTSKTSTHRLVTGRLGSGGKGSVFVRTKAGNVRIR